MEESLSTETRCYRVGIHLLVVLGVFATLLATLGIFIWLRRGDWKFLGIVVVTSFLLFFLLQLLRLEIASTWFKYRNLTGSRKVDFTDIGRAYFEVLNTHKSPQGVAVFWVERRDGSRMKINLRTFPVEASAVLFNALESHGIQIEVPDAWSVRRTVDQIRAAQAKLGERGV